jgi:ketosteroid isomerase-like protein
MQSPSLQETGQTKEESIEAVRNELKKFENYVNARDLDSLMTLYFDEVIYMQHGVDTIQGRDRLKQQFANMFGKSTNTSLDVREVDVCADMAYAYIVTTVLPKVEGDEVPKKVILRVLEIWRWHPDQCWKLTRIAVNNPPLP